MVHRLAAALSVRPVRRFKGAVFSTRDLHASLAGSLSVGAGRAQGQGLDVEEYAERIYRANITLGLAEVPRDYFDSAQAPDF
jgi:hypothetical protein